MGKRELVLIAAFALIGVVVYRFTAPPPPPGSEGASVSGILRSMERGVRGNRATAAAESHEALKVEPSVRELRIVVPRFSDITITGEAREDIAADVHTAARGFDEREATAAAQATKLKLTRAGDAIVATVDISAMRSLPRNTPIPQLKMTMAIPQRMAVRLEPHFGPLTVSNVASLDLMGSRGDTRVRGISGAVTMTHASGTLEIADCRTLKLTAHNSRGTVRDVAGAASIESLGGDLHLTEIRGPLDVESRSTELELDATTLTGGVLRINSTSGRLRLTAVRTETHIEAHNTDIDAALVASVPVSIYSTAGNIAVTAPTSGYSLDAVATEGQISLAQPVVKVTSAESEQRASGPVHGGGPAITLRTTRANIQIRAWVK
jgi:Putative adhesin